MKLVVALIEWILSFFKGDPSSTDDVEDIKNEQIEAEHQRPKSVRDLIDRMRNGKF